MAKTKKEPEKKKVDKPLDLRPMSSEEFEGIVKKIISKPPSEKVKK